MRMLGILTCRDCGGRHEIHVNNGGKLLALVACPAARGSRLPHPARDLLREHLNEAHHELAVAHRMFQSPDVNFRELAKQLDEVHRRLCRVQCTVDRHVRRR